MKKININELKVDSKLFEFVNTEIIPGTSINQEDFWSKFEKAVHYLAPINKNLIIKREKIQKQIDEWHIHKRDKKIDKNEYIIFLKSIDYIVKEKENFEITTSNVDKEISSIAGAQLVVPVDNARYALNAANARWGSLYDALYGTDAISGNKETGYNVERGEKVINYVKSLFDQIIPLSQNQWSNVTKIKVDGEKLALFIREEKHYLKNENQFIGFNGSKDNPKSILIKFLNSSIAS